MKKGRAEYVNDSTICLSTPCPSGNMEDNEMEHKLFFDAREWRFNPECSTNKGERSFLTGVLGDMAEAYTIGTWNNRDYTEIVGPVLTLEKNTPYTFTFWLNGGENDRYGDEICQLHIIMNNDKENAYVYKLNRNFIKPVKRYRGWNLYEISFTTGDNEFTQMKFAAGGAFTTVMAAKDKEAYQELEDVLDEFEVWRPQRHNIVWPDGWPSNTWYSTQALRQKAKSPHVTEQMMAKVRKKLLDEFDLDMDSDVLADEIWAKLSSDFTHSDTARDQLLDELIEDLEIEDLQEEIQEQIRGRVDMESVRKILRDRLAENLGSLPE